MPGLPDRLGFGALQSAATDIAMQQITLRCTDKALTTAIVPQAGVRRWYRPAPRRNFPARESAESSIRGRHTMVESLIAWLIVGAIAGWLAGLLVKGFGFGLIGNIVVGIVGAVIA